VARRSAGKPVRRLFRRPAAAPPPGYAGTKATAGHQWRQRLDRGAECHRNAAVASRPRETALPDHEAGIEALAAEFLAKPLSVRGIGETETTIRDIVPPHRVPGRTQRKPTAEFVDDKIVASRRVSHVRRYKTQVVSGVPDGANCPPRTCPDSFDRQQRRKRSFVPR
jgi:hypothetical protein